MLQNKNVYNILYYKCIYNVRRTFNKHYIDFTRE